ncbi:MAG: 4-(cytidine 5'-diphospho)-2-C-methyl-D-erythritol kinase [Bacteroidota bacterium]
MNLHRLAPAKINLGLHLLRKRPDGYHDLDTVFARIGWADALTATSAETFRFTCSDPALPTGPGNLCVRAAQALAAHAGVPMTGHLHLEKHVPYGAGLGGGSSDAATTLYLLRDLWGVAVADESLHDLATVLGSDVPFFLGPPLARGTGRGTHLTPLAADLPFWLVVVVPAHLTISTPDAYRHVRPHDTERPHLPALVQQADLTIWRADLVNDFEAALFPSLPALADLKDALYDLGAGYAALSGSGSALFGVFTTATPAEHAATHLHEAGHRVWHGALSAH